MGCDYYANEKGEFHITFHSYRTSRILGEVKLTGLGPNHPISRDLLEGRDR